MFFFLIFLVFSCFFYFLIILYVDSTHEISVVVCTHLYMYTYNSGVFDQQSLSTVVYRLLPCRLPSSTSLKPTQTACVGFVRSVHHCSFPGPRYASSSPLTAWWVCMCTDNTIHNVNVQRAATRKITGRVGNYIQIARSRVSLTAGLSRRAAGSARA